MGTCRQTRGKTCGLRVRMALRTSFPTGMWRVQVALFKLTGLGGCLLTHFSTELDVLRCVGKVLLTSFQTNRCCKIKTAWTAITVSALIHVEVLISSLQILVSCAKLSRTEWAIRRCVRPQNSTQNGSHLNILQIYSYLFVFQILVQTCLHCIFTISKQIWTFLDALERSRKHLSNRLSMYMRNFVCPA